METLIPLYLMLVVTLISVIALLVITRAHSRLLDQYHALKEKKKDKKALRGDAEAIVREAQDKAEEIIRKARVLRDDVGEGFEVELSKVTEMEVDKFREALNEARRRAVEMIEASAAAMVEESKRATDEEYERVRSEAEAYKQKKLEDIDKQVTQQVIKMSRKVLAGSIDPATHEKLVLKAIAQAKKDNVL